jgi:hypothetical protein
MFSDSIVYITGSGLPDFEYSPSLGFLSDEIFSSHHVQDTIGVWVAAGNLKKNK